MDAELCIFSGGSGDLPLVDAHRSRLRSCQFSSSSRISLLILGGGPHVVSGCTFGPVTTRAFSSAVRAENSAIRFENNVFSSCIYGYAALEIYSNSADSVEIIGNTFASCHGLADLPSALGAIAYISLNAIETGPLIEGNLFSNCSGISTADDIMADWSSISRIRDNTFRNDSLNSLPSIYAGNPSWQMAPLTLINNRWENCGYAVDLSAAADARENYWGHNSGPYHAAYNPEGQGDTITGEVPFVPWLIDSTDEAENRFELPRELTLAAYPNPFNAQTQIRFTLTSRGHVKITVFDLLGRETGVLLNETREAGSHDTHFDGSSLPSGLYFARLETANASRVARLLLLK
ncbi:MAG: T9SS type A sorting domain-containing protein [bacterium]|nr:T9SS type A sorting domain-containing protein [bacterium]